MRFSATMRKICSRSALLVGFLPTTACFRESHFQYSSNPARCQRTTVSAWTKTKVRRHSGHSRRNASQNNRSYWANRGRGLRRAKTASCCLKARFSKRRSRRDRKERAKSKNNSLRTHCMPRLYHRKHNRIDADGILARDTSVCWQDSTHNTARPSPEGRHAVAATFWLVPPESASRGLAPWHGRTPDRAGGRERAGTPRGYPVAGPPDLHP